MALAESLDRNMEMIGTLKRQYATYEKIISEIFGHPHAPLPNLQTQLQNGSQNMVNEVPNPLDTEYMGLMN